MSTVGQRSTVALGFVLAACSAGPESAVTPRRTLDQSPLMAMGGATQQVTGHANVFLPNFQAEQRYSNSAIRHADGTFSGEFQLVSEQEEGVTVHGNVVCFSIVGGRLARMGGIVERSDPEGFEGRHVIWTVSDNGEGAGARPDETSDFFVVSLGIAQAHCTVGFTLPLLPVMGGNLQVHR